MKNKILASAVAAILCIMMLGTVSFAGGIDTIPLPNKGTEGKMITAKAGSIVAEDGTIIRNVIEVNEEFPTPIDTVTEVGYKITKVGGLSTERIKKDIKTEIEGGGTVRFSLFMIGVPFDVIMQFVPYVCTSDDSTVGGSTAEEINEIMSKVHAAGFSANYDKTIHFDAYSW